MLVEGVLADEVRKRSWTGSCLLRWEVWTHIEPIGSQQRFWRRRVIHPECEDVCSHCMYKMSWVGDMTAGDYCNRLDMRKAEFEWRSLWKIRVDINTWETFGWWSKEREAWKLMPSMEREYEPGWDWPWTQSVQLGHADRASRERPLNHWKELRRHIKASNSVWYLQRWCLKPWMEWIFFRGWGFEGRKVPKPWEITVFKKEEGRQRISGDWEGAVKERTRVWKVRGHVHKEYVIWQWPGH